MRAERMRFAVRRAASMLLTLAASSVLIFSMIYLVPGDPVDNMLGETAPAAERERLQKALHLDEPMAARFKRFVASMADGTLGKSFRYPDRTVVSLIAEVFPLTLQLAVASMLVAWLLALPLGILSALHPGRPIDLASTSFCLVGISIPNMYLGPLLLFVFYIHLGWAEGPAPDNPSSLASLVLPAFTLGTALMAMLARMTRASLVEVMSEDYILTARAKGLGRLAVVIKHGLRNAMIPVITVAGLQFGALLSGAIITEKVFARPGIGTLLLTAISSRDYPLMQGCVLCVAFFYIAVNTLTDLLYRLADPRVRIG